MSESDIPISRLKRRYVDALMRGEEAQCGLIIDEALHQGLDVTRIYLEILAPAQVDIGDGWHDGDVNVAQEHLATQITLIQMDRLRTHLVPWGKSGYKVVVTSVEGDAHFLGARMTADFFLADGWDVDFLGPETPAADLAEWVRRRSADLVVISVTVEDGLPQLEWTIRSLASLPNPPKVLVGGNLLAERPRIASDLGAHAVARSLADAVPLGRELIGLPTTHASLEQHLEFMGKRIQELRRERGWNQQQLADLAGLDRTYISAVEHGKQNLTLGAVVKLATALDVELGHLLEGGSRRETGRLTGGNGGVNR